METHPVPGPRVGPGRKASGPSPGTGASGLRELIAQHLGGGCFPATGNQLLAVSMRRHAPSEVWWLLGRLSPTRRYASLDEVVAALEATPAPEGPGARGLERLS